MLASLAYAMDAYLIGNRQVTHLYYEEPLNIAVAMRIGASDKVIGMLRGCIGVAESVAGNHGIPIEPINVHKARRHLCGQFMLPLGKGKETVMRACRTLGWEPKNDNESDAAAIWALGCAMANPRTAHLTSELFARRKR